MEQLVSMDQLPEIRPALSLPSFSLSLVIEGRKNTGQVREILGRGEVGVDLGSVGLYVEGRLTNELLVISRD